MCREKYKGFGPSMVGPTHIPKKQHKALVLVLVLALPSAVAQL